MLLWIIQTTIISFVFIYLIHHLLCFFTDVLTVPKVKDLVNSSNKEYENIYNTISHKTSDNSTDINLLPTQEQPLNSMKDELKNFMKKQLDGESYVPTVTDSYSMF
jgi:cell shape-determining protein MreC